jgi:cytochrome c oxidase subunit 2
MYGLWWFFVVICGIVYLTVLVFLALALWRARSPHTDPATGRRVRRTIAGAVLLTALILVAVLVASVAVGKTVAAVPTKPAPVVVEVRGQQWWWEITYPDQVASNTVVTANEIHIPTGRPVMLRLSSLDVIHSFWVPSLHGKMDLISSRINTTWMQADRPGVFRGQCAEFCGLQHAHMGLFVVAEPPELFDRWLANERRPAVEPFDAVRRRGKEVFFNAPCLLCHSIRGTEAFGQVAPDLTHFGSRRSIGAATLPNTTGNLAGWIADSHRIKPGNRMPPMSIAPADMQPLLAYLEGLK